MYVIFVTADLKNMCTLGTIFSTMSAYQKIMFLFLNQNIGCWNFGAPKTYVKNDGC